MRSHLARRALAAFSATSLFLFGCGSANEDVPVDDGAIDAATDASAIGDADLAADSAVLGDATSAADAAASDVSPGEVDGAVTEPLVDVDFEARTEDAPYEVDAIREDFAKHGCVLDEGKLGLRWPAGYADVVADPDAPKNRVLRILERTGERLQEKQFNVQFPHAVTAAVITYRVRFGEGFQFRAAFKLPRVRGIYAGCAAPAGSKAGCHLHSDPDPDGPEGPLAPVGFTSAMGYSGPATTFSPKGSFYPYVYWADQPHADVGSSFEMDTPAPIVPGKWYAVRMVTRMNTPGAPGANDGVFEIEIDGVNRYRRVDFRFRDRAEDGINLFSFMSWSNDGTVADEHVYFDDFRVLSLE